VGRVYRCIDMGEYSATMTELDIDGNLYLLDPHGVVVHKQQLADWFVFWKVYVKEHPPGEQKEQAESNLKEMAEALGVKYE